MALSSIRGSRTFLLLIAAVPACSQRSGADGSISGESGARIFYQVAGPGDDTVVVVHGGPGAGINGIRPDVEPLTQDHVVIFYDQRGGGRSDLPKDTTQLGPRTRPLGLVTAPLLIIHGERDTLGLPMARAWAKALPNARLHIVPNAGRAAHAERPNAVFPAIREFLNGRSTGSALRLR